MVSHRGFSFAIAVALLVILPASADQLSSVAFPTGMGEFNVINGKPCLLRPGEKGPDFLLPVDIKGTSLVHFRSKESLAYPLGGTKTPVITLGKAEGVGTSWDLSGIGPKRPGPIRAAEGKFKGWYLDWSDSETEVVFKGKTLHVRELILVENPKAPRQFSTYEVSN
jgi:hypothetical protein